MTANYSGDGTNYVASSGSSTQTVNKVASSPSLNITPSPGAGQASTFSVTVFARAPTPTGTVTPISVTAHPAVLTSSGTASTTHTYATAAHFTTTLTYSGDTNYTGTTINNLFTVDKRHRAPPLLHPPIRVRSASPVTFTATVTGLNSRGHRPVLR